MVIDHNRIQVVTHPRSKSNFFCQLLQSQTGFDLVSEPFHNKKQMFYSGHFSPIDRDTIDAWEYIAKDINGRQNIIVKFMLHQFNFVETLSPQAAREYNANDYYNFLLIRKKAYETLISGIASTYIRVYINSKYNEKHIKSLSEKATGEYLDFCAKIVFNWYFDLLCNDNIRYDSVLYSENLDNSFKISNYINYTKAAVEPSIKNEKTNLMDEIAKDHSLIERCQAALDKLSNGDLKFHNGILQ